MFKCIHFKTLEDWLNNKIYKPEEVEASLKVTFEYENLVNLSKDDLDEEDKSESSFFSFSQASTDNSSQGTSSSPKKGKSKKIIMEISTKFNLFEGTGLELYTKVVSKLLANKVERNLEANSSEPNWFNTEISKEYKKFEHFIAQTLKSSRTSFETKELLRCDKKISHMCIRILEKLNWISINQETGKVVEYIDKVSQMKMKFKEKSSEIEDNIKAAIISLLDSRM